MAMVLLAVGSPREDGLNQLEAKGAVWIYSRSGDKLYRQLGDKVGGEGAMGFALQGN